VKRTERGANKSKNVTPADGQAASTFSSVVRLFVIFNKSTPTRARGLDSVAPRAADERAIKTSMNAKGYAVKAMP